MGDKLKIFFHKFTFDRNYQLSLVAAIMLAGAAFVWFGVWFDVSHRLNNGSVSNQINENVNAVLPPVKIETTAPRKTDGVIVPLDQANKIPAAVMIENLASEGVRPQYGLQKAEIVYEITTEGGITRFMALFSSTEEIKQIGPVRSARPTYLEFSSEYPALYAHAGGSPEALAEIDGLKIPDCSALSADSRFFWRDNTRLAPHNLFTSSTLLNYALRDKGMQETESNFLTWKFKDEKKVGIIDQLNEKFIKINFSTPEYQVTWKYNQENNDYQRYYGEQAHKDALTDEIITAKNIIIEIVPPAIDAGDKGRVNFDVNGEGKVYIFRDGEKIEGLWKKNGRENRTQFFTTDNQEISLNRGKIWIEILPSDKTFENN